jgi:hypothetical protein
MRLLCVLDFPTDGSRKTRFLERHSLRYMKYTTLCCVVLTMGADAEQTHFTHVKIITDERVEEVVPRDVWEKILAQNSGLKRVVADQKDRVSDLEAEIEDLRTRLEQAKVFVRTDS